MDAIEKLAAEEERRRQVATCTEDVRSAALADGAKSDIRPEEWPVTIIGCVRGVTGWFTAGYDERKRVIVPLGRIARNKTNRTNKTNTAEGRKP